MSQSGDSIDWTKTTFEGSRREQLRRWCALSLRQRLEALDALSAHAAAARPGVPGEEKVSYRNSGEA